ncbi:MULTISPECIES: hypothetical protein [unclassified Kribbella]|uniref:hypothetical protein n=1 Tax=unclassified Kribbella TaxID=2644121 RepID=UPI00301A8F76
MQNFQPAQDTGNRPDLPVDDGKILYLKSYLVMRAVIGFIGLFLPIALLVGDILFLKGTTEARGSLSAYYHSGMRDVFVGSLCVTALFLITYKVFEKYRENVLSVIAGVAALGVAWLPTGRPAGSTSPATPLQERLGEGLVTTLHFICAAIFILSLAVISYDFGKREGVRRSRQSTFSSTFWRWLHWSCALAIVAAVLFMLLSKLIDGFGGRNAILIGETVAGLAFGLSWLTKGLELRILREPVHITPTGPAPKEAVTPAS